MTDRTSHAAMSDELEQTVWKATDKFGRSCHFGHKGLAEAWAKESGKVEGIKLRNFALVVHEPAVPTAQAVESDRDDLEGMAECMRMFREGMIKAGVIGDNVPPMFMSEAILGAIGKARAEALEEAAQIADYEYHMDKEYDAEDRAVIENVNAALRNCAKAIRELKSQQPAQADKDKP